MKVKIREISYYLPEHIDSIDLIKIDNPDWDIPSILEKTGIQNRYIAGVGETAVDLAFKAGKKLLEEYTGREEIDLLILVTQSPDYVLPTSACILQERLGLSKDCMAFDINQGCSGFINALGIVGGLIESGVAHRGLILCADTYSKYIRKNDRTCRPLFSDGAAGILVEGSATDSVGPFVFGTDGSGYEHLIVRCSGARDADQVAGSGGRVLEMSGSDVFLFTMRVIPPCVGKLLNRAGLTLEEVELFVFHQASKLVIDNLVRRLSLDQSKVFTNYQNVGNTVSASIPIALKDAVNQGRLRKGDIVMIIGFGVGLSWGATLVRWTMPS